MFKYIILLIMIFSLSMAAPARAAEAGDGTIEGQLVNRTENGSSVAAQDVILSIYLDDTEVDSVTSKTDAEGRFVFNSLSTEQGYTYEVKAVYQEADYFSELISFNEGEKTKPIEVVVYDSTTDDEAITVMTAHTVVYIDQGSLYIKDYYMFVSDTDRTYIGLESINGEVNRETLKFSLPNGIEEFQIGNGLMQCCILGNAEGFSDSMPVLPGVKEIAYSYSMDGSSGGFQLAQKVNYPTNNFDLLIQGEEVEVVTSSQLVEQEPFYIDGVAFNHFSGANIDRNDIMFIEISGLSAASSQNPVLWAILTLVFLFGIVYFVYLTRKRRVPQVRTVENTEHNAQSLLLELAQLDDDFESGRTNEEDYRRLRAEKKAQLVKLMQNSPTENSRR